MDALIGLALALPLATTTGISTTTGVAQGVSEQKKSNADACSQSRMLKFQLDVWLDEPSTAPLADSTVTVRDHKLWVERRDSRAAAARSHPFTGFYLAYPDAERGHTRGLVTTVSAAPPVLNWVFVDRETLEVRHAGRSGSVAHLVGDWDWTRDAAEGSDVVFEGWEGFVAVEERGGGWALYFDRGDDGLRGRREGRRVVEVHLRRRVVVGQELNRWGLKEEGNIGVRSTREV